MNYQYFVMYSPYTFKCMHLEDAFNQSDIRGIHVISSLKNQTHDLDIATTILYCLSCTGML